jgi:hypothetical protein
MTERTVASDAGAITTPMAHSHGGPSNKWCDIIGGELVRGERSVEQFDFRRTPAQSRAFADRSENVASPVPIAWHWKERHRPSEVSAVSAARRLGYGIQGLGDKPLPDFTPSWSVTHGAWSVASFPDY